MELPGWFRYTTYAGFGIFALLLVLGLVLAVWRVSNRSKTSGIVVGIIGRMGAGKSYAAVRMALDRLERGVDVCSNFTIDTTKLKTKNPGNWRPFYGLEDFATLRDCVVIIDEADLYAPSHQHLYFPPEARMAFKFARKHRLDIYWLTQHEDRVNKTVKALTNVMRLTEAYFGGRMFVVTEWEPERFRKPKKHLSRYRYFRRQWISDLYDTAEIIEPDEHFMVGDVSRARPGGRRRPGERSEPAARPVPRPLPASASAWRGSQ